MQICAVLVLLISVGVVEIQSSAIPMWEFLSKQEKMSYLYAMLKNQVAEFCVQNQNHGMKNCNDELLRYGVGKLKDMPEDHLDIMDPYQRGANDIIWDSMMEGHEMMKKTTPKPSTTPKPNSYEDDEFDIDHYDDLTDFAASARIDSIYRGPILQNTLNNHNNQHANGKIYELKSGLPQYIQSDENNQRRVDQRFFPKYPTNGPSRNYYNNRETYAPIPLTGPMVIKVYPDGRPVYDNSQSIPQDEDLRQYQMSKLKLPNF